MAISNRTYNSEVTANVFEQIALTGRLFGIGTRWEDIGRNQKRSLLLDVRSDWFSFQINFATTGPFFADAYQVQSYSGGTVPDISNRNFLFDQVNSLTSVVLIGATIEVQANSTSIAKRLLATGGRSSESGTFAGTQVHVPPGSLLFFEIQNKSMTSEDADFFLIGFEGFINSLDFG